MGLARTLAKWRHALVIPLVLAGLASTPVFAREVIVIREAPPPMRVEPAPVGRPGYVWDQGHWGWQGRYVWVPGHWQPVMRNARWQPGHWVARGPNWHWVQGRWVR